MKVSDLSVNRYFIYKYHHCEFLAKTVEPLNSVADLNVLMTSVLCDVEEL